MLKTAYDEGFEAGYSDAMEKNASLLASMANAGLKKYRGVPAVNKAVIKSTLTQPNNQFFNKHFTNSMADSKATGGMSSEFYNKYFNK